MFIQSLSHQSLLLPSVMTAAIIGVPPPVLPPATDHSPTALTPASSSIGEERRDPTDPGRVSEDLWDMFA